MISKLLHGTAKSARRHRVVAALLGFLAVFGTVAVVYAAASSPPFTLSASPSTQTINSGASASYTMSILPQTGFTDAVTLTAASLPKGTSASWTVGGKTTSGASVTVPAGSGTRAVTLAIGGGQPPAGTYTVTVSGSSTSGSNSTTLSLVVVNQNAANFAFSVSPSNVSPVAGSPGSAATVSITRTNWTGSVTLGPVSGLPAGATATFGSSTTLSTTASSASLTITTTPWTTQPGTYTLVLPGTAVLSGKTATTNYAAFTLTVPQPGNFAISGNLASPLTLGNGGVRPLNLSISNPNGTPLTLDHIVVTLASVKQALGASGTCNQSGSNSPNFQIANLDPSYSVTVPANATRTLSQLGALQPKVTWVDQPWPQNGCLGASLSFTYSAQGRY